MKLTQSAISKILKRPWEFMSMLDDRLARKSNKPKANANKTDLLICEDKDTDVFLNEVVKDESMEEEVLDSEEEEREVKRQRNSSMLGLEMAFLNHVPLNEKETLMLELMRETTDRLKKDDVDARKQTSILHFFSPKKQ
ncbi:hypothetical protein RMATCC62417_16610 [Rhizopus microsporus]|nr:hypothetical protein RMATCC62417_16610 [Rhizopus microsporus]